LIQLLYVLHTKNLTNASDAANRILANLCLSGKRAALLQTNLVKYAGHGWAFFSPYSQLLWQCAFRIGRGTRFEGQKCYDLGDHKVKCFNFSMEEEEKRERFE
jgi:hypothetical protein